MKAPENVDGLLDHLSLFHAEVRKASQDLPASKVKGMLTEILNTVEPMTVELRSLYPQLMAAFSGQRSEAEQMLQQAKDNIAKAQAMMASLPSVEQIKKNLVPLAAALPVGLTGFYAAEMRTRYLEVPVADPLHETQGTAWQDWAVN
jgi:hypothetical protein